MDMNTAVTVAVVASVVGLLFALYQRSFVLSQDEGSERMKQIAARKPSSAANTGRWRFWC